MKDMTEVQCELLELIMMLPAEWLQSNSRLTPRQRIPYTPEQISEHIHYLDGITNNQREMLEILMRLPREWILSLFSDPLPRFDGGTLKQFLTILDHDHQALALPLDVLKLLPKEYFQSLSPEIQAQLEVRLAKP